PETLVIGILRPKCLKNPRRDRAGSVNTKIARKERSRLSSYVPYRCAIASKLKTNLRAIVRIEHDY
ncbi:hypothetical protein QUB70_27075, partial [Microcoleus sp. A003_D6]|uniref:hypothetical protein n=1 Tax=Microcoleus sp. A003_D6 TaxID=3055266 RepID=UPI002FD27409